MKKGILWKGITLTYIEIYLKSSHGELFILSDKEFILSFQTNFLSASLSQLQFPRHLKIAMESESCKIILRAPSVERPAGSDHDQEHHEEAVLSNSDQRPGAPAPGLLQSLSVPGSDFPDTPYHKLRRASHHIISGRSQDSLQLSSRTDITEGRWCSFVTVTKL